MNTVHDPRSTSPGLPLVLLLAALALIAACATGKALPRDQIEHPGQLLFNGYANEKVNCYECHGGTATTGEGGPNLQKRVPEMTDKDILDTIRYGTPFMPSFEEHTTEEERKQILDWLRSEFGGGG